MPCYFAILVISLQIFVNYYFGNMFFVVWLAYVALPILDYLIPVDHRNLEPERVRAFDKDKRFLIPLYLMWILDFGMFYYILHLVSVGQIAKSGFAFLMYAVSYA